jgi:hypothetical protein
VTALWLTSTAGSSMSAGLDGLRATAVARRAHSPVGRCCAAHRAPPCCLRAMGCRLGPGIERSRTLARPRQPSVPASARGHAETWRATELQPRHPWAPRVRPARRLAVPAAKGARQAWDASHESYHSGRNDGFVRASGPARCASGKAGPSIHLFARRALPDRRALLVWTGRAGILGGNGARKG